MKEIRYIRPKSEFDWSIKIEKRKRPPKKQRKLMTKRAKWMREGAQTVHEGIAQYILIQVCENFKLTSKNQKIFYDETNKKWYIADFFIPEINLVIEIDGLSHKKKQKYDKKRTEFLESLGNRVIRFKNEELESFKFRDKIEEILKECICSP